MTALRLALKSASFHVRNLRTRLPFRYGIVTGLEDWRFESLETAT